MMPTHKHTSFITLLFLLAAFSSIQRAPAADADSQPGWKLDLFPVDVKGKWGYIDEKGKIVIEPTFESAANFTEGLAAVKANGKYGYIDRTGKFVIQPE